MRKWYNIELRRDDPAGENLRAYLKQNGITYEPSGAGSYVHFEILLSDAEKTALEKAVDF